MIRDSVSGAPVVGATVSVQGVNHHVMSNSDGTYVRLLAPGQYTITVSKPKSVHSMFLQTFTIFANLRTLES